MLSLLTSTTWLVAGDWPQILGPQRNGVTSEDLPAEYLHGTPRLVWKIKLGEGYAGPAVSEDRVIAFHRLGESERVQCVNAKDGTPLWQTDFPATYRGGIDPDTGPRCVPLIHSTGDNLFVVVLGAGGNCHAVDGKTGKALWSRNLAEEFQAPDGYFGAGSTPLVLQDTVLINVGGKQAGIVGLDLATGKNRFAVGKEQASYASPTLITQGKTQQALFITRLNFVRVTASGEQTILAPFGRTGPTVNAAVPILSANKREVFLTSSYGVGGMLLDLQHPQEPIWSNDESLSSQYSTPVEHNGFLYGIHGREDIPPAHLRCVEWKTGKVRWSRDDFGVAHLIRIGNEIVITTVGGELVVIAANPERYEEITRHRLTPATTRALPAFANGRLYLRLNDGKTGALHCYAWEK